MLHMQEQADFRSALETGETGEAQSLSQASSALAVGHMETKGVEHPDGHAGTIEMGMKATRQGPQGPFSCLPTQPPTLSESDTWRQQQLLHNKPFLKSTGMKKNFPTNGSEPEAKGEAAAASH